MHLVSIIRFKATKTIPERAEPRSGGRILAVTGGNAAGANQTHGEEGAGGRPLVNTTPSTSYHLFPLA